VNLPIWLDPTPAVRAFVGSFANAPVREPFAHLRNKMMNVTLTWKQRMREAAFKRQETARQNALKGGAKNHAKALEDAMARGETMEERLRRQKNESQIRRREREGAGRRVISAAGNSKRFAPLA